MFVVSWTAVVEANTPPATVKQTILEAKSLRVCLYITG
jgi:hypothetical protein